MAQQADFGPFFSPTGNLHQITYSQKKVDNSPTILGMKSKHGIVLITEKPIKLKYQKIDKKKRHHRVTDKIRITQTGIDTDVIPLKKFLVDQSRYHHGMFHEGYCGKAYRKLISYYMCAYSRNWSLRPLGINVITGLFDGKYNLYKTDTSGLSKSYNACVSGKGSARAITELEKLDLEDMSIKEMMRAGVKILYKTFDDTKDSPFKIEISYISKETENNFISAETSEFEQYVDEFEGLTVDD